MRTLVFVMVFIVVSCVTALGLEPAAIPGGQQGMPNNNEQIRIIGLEQVRINKKQFDGLNHTERTKIVEKLVDAGLLNKGGKLVPDPSLLVTKDQLFQAVCASACSQAVSESISGHCERKYKGKPNLIVSCKESYNNAGDRCRSHCK